MSRKTSWVLSEEKCVCGFQEKCEMLQILGSKGQKDLLEQGCHIRRGFNGEAYGLSVGGGWEDQQISQQVESDATSPSLDSSVSFEITPEVTQDDDHVADEDDDDIEDQGQVMSDV